MRSRLETRWAAFFDELGWSWTYEPFQLGNYVPDFVLQFHKPLLVEVKGDDTTTTDIVTRAREGGWTREMLVVRYGLSEPQEFGDRSDDLWSVGDLVGEPSESHACCLDRSCFLCRLYGRGPTIWSGSRFGFRDRAVLFSCKECERSSLAGVEGDWTCRICGLQGDNGNGHWGLLNPRPAWARACNRTRFACT